MKFKKVIATLTATALAASIACAPAFAANSVTNKTTPATPKAGSTIKVTTSGKTTSTNIAKVTVVKSGNTVALKYTSLASKYKKKKSVKTFTIAKTIKGYKVTGIAKKFFKGSKIKTVKVKSVSISAKAMKAAVKGSKVKTIKVPKKLYKAYKKAFKNTKFKIKKY